MTTPAPYPVAPMPTRMSKSSLCSLIFGILGCVPLVTGLLAILSGIVGFVRTGKPGVTGRWMAVVGTILGVLSTGVWSFVLAMWGLAIFAVFGILAQPKTTTHDFIKELSAGNVAAAKAYAPGIADEQLNTIAEYLKKQGTFEDTTFTTANMNNEDTRLEGTAKFSGGTQNVTADLKLAGGKWEIQSIEIKPKE